MNAPALIVAIPILLGVLCGAGMMVSTAVVGVATAVAWTVAALALWRDARIVCLAACIAGFFSAGAAIGARAQQSSAPPSLLSWYRHAAADGPVALTGVLRADAAIGASSVTLVLDVETADGRRLDGGARLSVVGTLATAAAIAWRAGRRIAVDAALHEPIDYRDPGVASDRDRLARQGIVLLGSVKSAALVTVLARGSVLSETAAALRARVRAATALTVGRWSSSSAGVVTAILIGDRSGLDAEDERRLQEAGTYHVIAISGGNIALLTALLVLGGRLARLPPRATAVASIALLAFYGYAAGLAPSVLRATVAGMVYLSARASDHRGAALNAIAVAAAFAAIVAPLSVLDPGFVLSFGATFAIVIAAQRVQWRATMTRAERRGGGARVWMIIAVNAAVALGTATLCAEVALAPVGARVFGRVSFAGLLLNFLAIPLMSLIQIAGLIAVGLAAVSASAGAIAGWVAHVATLALLRSASLVDLCPWLVVDLPPPCWTVIATWYAGWATLLFTSSRALRVGGAAVATAAGALLLASPPATRATLMARPPPGWTRVVFLDVGQGDATLILPFGGDPILVDAGGVPGTTFDLGRRVTLPAVWAFGVSRLAALTLTHGDPDHIGGAPPILRALSPREIWDGIPVPPHEPLRRLHERADALDIPWVAMTAGQSRAFGSTALRVLHPPAPTWERRRVRNDDSIVLHVRVGDVSIVLPGDVTQSVEPDVIAAFEPSPIVIVKAPHHGSAGSSSQPFVAALHAVAVIFSAGQRNPFGHPAPIVVERYRTAGAHIFSTPQDGAIVIDTDGRRVRICGWASGRCSEFDSGDKH